MYNAKLAKQFAQETHTDWHFKAVNVFFLFFSFNTVSVRFFTRSDSLYLTTSYSWILQSAVSFRISSVTMRDCYLHNIEGGEEKWGEQAKNEIKLSARYDFQSKH